MSFSDNYFSRYNSYSQFFNEPVNENTDIIVVIPCFDDPHIFKTLDSLQNTTKNNIGLEVIVIVNSGESTPLSIIETNRKIFEKLVTLKELNYYNFNLLVKNLEKVPNKTAGVGNARKAGMDEAVRRFSQIGKPNGIITSLDADCIVENDYLISITNTFLSDRKVEATTLQFRHDFDKNLYQEKVIRACKQYEIYLRYFRLSLKLTGFPYYFHTIGSCFAVTASSYIKAGGMSRRQGGEDFYFLHKVAPMTKIEEIKKILVFPSPRISERVPFGTGPSVKNIINNDNYKVYNFRLFSVIKQFYNCFENYFDTNDNLFDFIPDEIIQYVGKGKLTELISECKKNTKDLLSFKKRMNSKFDAFFIIKFLNSFDLNSKYPPQDNLEAAKLLLEYYGIESGIYEIECIYDKILDIDLTN
ncbi:MAG: hypothetical protein LBQ22_07810 [Bacteroidales bacterium]|jgi:hypothetical protein|nr:hypothetical protein [Bacteroidales bacterium]